MREKTKMSHAPPVHDLSINLLAVAFVAPVLTVVRSLLRQEHDRRAHTAFLTVGHQLVPELCLDTWPACDAVAITLIADVAVEG